MFEREFYLKKKKVFNKGVHPSIHTHMHTDTHICFLFFSLIIKAPDFPGAYKAIKFKSLRVYPMHLMKLGLTPNVS